MEIAILVLMGLVYLGYLLSVVWWIRTGGDEVDSSKILLGVATLLTASISISNSKPEIIFHWLLVIALIVTTKYKNNWLPEWIFSKNIIQYYWSILLLMISIYIWLDPHTMAIRILSVISLIGFFIMLNQLIRTRIQRRGAL